MTSNTMDFKVVENKGNILKIILIDSLEVGFSIDSMA